MMIIITSESMITIMIIIHDGYDDCHNDDGGGPGFEVLQVTPT
jgi:hypothetical protein